MRILHLGLLVVASALVMISSVETAHATITVVGTATDEFNENNVCSLREAVLRISINWSTPAFHPASFSFKGSNIPE